MKKTNSTLIQQLLLETEKIKGELKLLISMNGSTKLFFILESKLNSIKNLIELEQELNNIKSKQN